MITSKNNKDIFMKKSNANVIMGSAVQKRYSLAEQGDASAQYHLGVVLQSDGEEAVKWLRLAAEQNHTSAQSHLGWMYDSGEGVPRDEAEAVKWYRLAAEQGDVLAQYNLGWMMHDQDGAEAVK
jgi:TPR repeat protein